MPMPPPKPTERGRALVEEQRQLVRALTANGPQTPERLAELVGAAYWRDGRFEHALTTAIADGLVHRTEAGDLAVP